MTTQEENQAQQVGAKLRQIREKNGKNQSDFAKVLGINQNAYSGIESGKRLPTSSQIQIILQNFDVTYDWLMGSINTNDAITLNDSNQDYLQNGGDCNTIKALYEMLKKDCEGKDEQIAYLKKCLDAKSKELEYSLQSLKISENQSLVLAGIIDRLTQK